MPHTIIFCGTPDFAVPSLNALLSDKVFKVIAVITQPDKPAGRSQKMTSPPVKIVAEEKGIPVFQPENINLFLPDYIENHPAMKPDFLVVVAYGKILKQPTLDLPNIAPVNVHGSILPRWRGASPVEHAILAGDTETGVTVQIMTAGLDEGPILSIASTPIDQRATPLRPSGFAGQASNPSAPLRASDLRATLSVLGAKLLVDTLKKPLKPVPQPTKGVTVCKKLKKEDGNVDPKSMTAIEIDRRVRAFTPWPGVRTTVEGQDLKLIETSLEEVPGSIPLLCSKGSTLYLVSVQPAGKKPMKASDWKRGIRI